MENVQHLVLTRFNLRLSNRSQRWGTDKFGNPIDHDQWLQHRFDLFERYCLPSMAAQKNQDFTWLIFFDSETAQRDRQRIERAREVCPRIRVVYLEGLDVIRSVLEHVDPETGMLITTRLDNDDSFHERALGVIREHALKARETTCVNLRYGFAFDGSNAEVVSHKFNPFSSLVEFRGEDSFKTIFGAAHGKIGRLAKVRQVYDAPYWLSVIHERNVANRSPSDYRQFSWGDWKGLRRYVKKYLLPRLRRHFWPPEVRRDYSLKEIEQLFHIEAD